MAANPSESNGIAPIIRAIKALTDASAEVGALGNFQFFGDFSTKLGVEEMVATLANITDELVNVKTLLEETALDHTQGDGGSDFGNNLDSGDDDDDDWDDDDDDDDWDDDDDDEDDDEEEDEDDTPWGEVDDDEDEDDWDDEDDDEWEDD